MRHNDSVSERSYRLAGRAASVGDTLISVKGFQVGNMNFSVIAGPCGVESYEGLYETAAAVQKAGATMLRGGAFKPRSSPYSFQGLGKKGLDYLADAGRSVGLPVVSELTDCAFLDWYAEIDVIQVGARNMQNYAMLSALGKIDKPILLKRGISSTLDELLLSAEYILNGGNEKVILCERGIRTFGDHTRYTFDISSIPVLKRLTHLPVIADPSHATGDAELVAPVAVAAAAAGCDGLMIEVHHNPETAKCDGFESLTHAQFGRLMNHIHAILPYSCKQY